MLDRDIRFYNNCLYGYLMKRENVMNDMTHVGHILAGKISQAVWGSNDFNKPIKEIRLRPKSHKEKVLETLRNKGLIDD